MSGSDNEDDNIFNGGQGTGGKGTQWEWAMQRVLIILRMMAEQKCYELACTGRRRGDEGRLAWGSRRKARRRQRSRQRQRAISSRLCERRQRRPLRQRGRQTAISRKWCERLPPPRRLLRWLPSCLHKLPPCPPPYPLIHIPHTYTQISKTI